MNTIEPDLGSIWWADFDAGVVLLGEADQDPQSDAVQPRIMRRLSSSVAEFLEAYPEQGHVPS